MLSPLPALTHTHARASKPRRLFKISRFFFIRSFLFFKTKCEKRITQNDTIRWVYMRNDVFANFFLEDLGEIEYETNRKQSPAMQKANVD